MKRGLLALAALVVVLVATFVVWSGGTSDVRRADQSTHESVGTEPDAAVEASALATSSDAVPPRERRAIDDRFAPVGQTVATSGGARLWSELLAPIDFATRAPVADATLVFFDASGARRERPLDGPIDQRDLRPGVLGVVDAPNHVARPFLPNDFASHAPGPLTVELRPSAALHIVADMSIDLSQRPIEYSIESGYDGRATGSDADRAAIDVSRRLRELLHGDLDVSARAQRVAALTVRREPAALPHFDLARTPDPSFGAQTRLTLPDRLPWVIDDLPAGVPIAIDMRIAEPLRIASTSDFATRDALKSVVFEPATSPRLVIERTLFGTVRGQLDDFDAGTHAIWIEPENVAPLAPRQVLAAERSGAFEIAPVATGRQRFGARWTTTGGVLTEYVRVVDVPADDVLDLGVLRADPDLERHRITLRPRVTIDGIEVEPAVDARLRDSSWSVDLLPFKPESVTIVPATAGGSARSSATAFEFEASGARRLEPSLRSMTARLGDAIVVEGVLPDRYRLLVRGQPAPRLDRLVLRPSIANPIVPITVASHVEQTVAVDLVSHWRTTFRFVHAGVDPLPPLELSMHRRGRSTIGFDPFAVATSVGDGSPQEHVLDEGSWVAEVRGAERGAGALPIERSQRLVGWSGFDVGETDESVVEIQLVAACALELSRAVVDAHPETNEIETRERLYVVGTHHDRAPHSSVHSTTYIVFEDLLPDSEYTIHPLGRKFRTGAPGSVTRIDA
jgi:hypothetical protein